MERLTKRCINGIDISNASHKLSGDNKSLFNRPEDYLGIVVSRLADYEDAEEQGLLVKLPCKVGDTVWMVNDNEKISEMVIRHIQTNGTGELYFYAKCKTMTVECFCITGCKCEICFSEKSMKEHRIFTTRKAAEAALKEMEADNGTD